MKEVWIMKLNNIQRDEQDETEVNLDTEILYTKTQKGERCITYPEAEASGMGNSMTKLCVAPDDMVTVFRTGEFSTNLVILPGKKHFCSYTTPYGNVSFIIHGKYVRNHLTDEGGTLDLCYTVNADAGLLTENVISLQIEKQRI